MRKWLRSWFAWRRHERGEEGRIELMYRDRWFGTPVGAALLVGALAGGLATVTDVAVLNPMISSFFSGQTEPLSVWFAAWARSFLTYSVLCAAPAISQRDLGKLLQGIGVGFLTGLIALASYWVMYLDLQRLSYTLNVYFALSAVRVVLCGLLLGNAIARLYGASEVRRRCTWVGGVCGAVVSVLTIILDRILFAGSTDPFGDAYAEVGYCLSFLTIAALLMVLPPAFIVERDLAKACENQEKGTGQHDADQ